MGSFAQSATLFLLSALASAGSAIAETQVKIEIADLSFSPSSVTVRAGETVEWVNKDVVEHTITAKNGKFNVDVPAGKSATWTVKRPGDVDYFCRFHPNMTGTIHILGPKD